MSDGIQWSDQISHQLQAIYAKSQFLQDDLAHGAEEILRDAKERVPKESSDLSRTGYIDRNRGNSSTVLIIFKGPYARWIHEHLWFKHPHGGEAKFLETALLFEGRNAIHKAGKKFWRRIT